MEVILKETENNNKIEKVESEISNITNLFKELQSIQLSGSNIKLFNEKFQNNNGKDEHHLNTIINKIDNSIANLEDLKFGNENDYFESEEELIKSEKNLLRGIKKQEKSINEVKVEIGNI